MTQKIEKSSNGTQNNNAESNNVYRLIEKTDEQLTSSASRYNERAENGQIITFTKAEQKKASSDAKNAKDGYLPGVFWTGYVVTADNEKHDFVRLDANGICRTFENVCTWKRATRATLLDGNANRTDEQRKEDAQKAIEDAKDKATGNSVTALLWKLLESCTWTSETGETMKAEIALNGWVINAMENKDAEAKETAQSKETKTAKAQRELQEAKQAAEAASNANAKAIQMLLATGMYKDEAEVREKLGL